MRIKEGRRLSDPPILFSSWSQVMKIASMYLFILSWSVYILACSMITKHKQTKGFPTGDYQYSGYSKQGDKIVAGRLSITSAEPRRIGAEVSTELKGNWEFRKVGNEEKIGAQVGSGDLIGSVNKGEIYIDLNPNVRDGNVILQGTIEGSRFHGKWSLHIISGVTNQGNFEAQRK